MHKYTVYPLFFFYKISPSVPSQYDKWSTRNRNLLIYCNFVFQFVYPIKDINLNILMKKTNRQK